MENKHNCKLCFKQFTNGKALGGHMKSHMAILQTPPPLLAKTQLIHQQQQQQLIDEIESASSTEDEEEVKGGLNYRLRENPKKSYRLVDPVFSSPMDAASIVLDRESETDESFKNPNPTRRRSKRIRKSSGVVSINQNLKKPTLIESFPVESEPVSSVSDTTPDEDVARCLMMLSRDVWMKEEEEEEEEENEEKSIDEEEDEEVEEEEEMKLCTPKKKMKKKYQCESCKKYFRSYQALGGHRANHKKIKGCIPFSSSSISVSPKSVLLLQKGSNVVDDIDQRSLECPICFKVFKNRQALGGHKRSHQSGSSTTVSTTTTSTPTSTPNSFKFGKKLIDLNFPAPIEEDEEEDNISQFVDPI